MGNDDQWVLASYEVKMTKDQIPSATVTLRRGKGAEAEEKSDTFFGGDGPLDALFRVVEKLTDVSVTVRDYHVQSVSQGKDVQGESTVEVEHQGRLYRGRGVSTDTVEASTMAFLNAVNRVAAGGGQDLSEYRPGAV